MRKLAACLVFVAAVCPVFKASACDLCAIYRGTEAKEARPGFNVGVSEQFTHFGTLQEDGEKVSNGAGQYMDSSITQFIIGYRFNEKAGVQTSVPFITRSFKRPEGFATDKGRETGMGDLSVIADYRVFETLTEDTFSIVTVFGGVKFPTGNSDRIKEELDEDAPPPGAPESGIHGHDLALGSGSYDALVGAAAAFHYDRFFVTANAQYAIRTRGELDYRYANDLIWGVKPGVFPYVDHEKTLGVQFAVTGETKGKDKFMGEKAQDTAVNSVFVGPEISFTWKDNISAEAGVDIPVYIDNSSLQIVPDYKVRAGFVWRM